MKIKIPNIQEEKYIENKNSIVLIGANGSGKTRMSVWIDNNNSNFNIHRISAQKSLNMPEVVRPTEINSAEELLLYGTTNSNKEWLRIDGKKNNRWANKPETFLLNDYEKLMEFLMTENYEKSIEYREEHKDGNNKFDNLTRLEQIKEIWENVITHRKLKISAGKIEVTNKEGEEKFYNGSQMSDGERAVFYFIGESLCAKADSLIIIDEPENHLHRSILIRLWNAIEASRPDCTFLYITHSLEFASSRINTQIIWVKDFIDNNTWLYELLEDNNNLDALKLEIMGNRQKVLLVEGTVDKSIDLKLYSKLYNEYNIISLESCNTVIQTVKSYNQTQNLHYAEVKGIVDRDRRDTEEIQKLEDKNIFVPNVAEIENLFLLHDIIKIVAMKQDKAEIEKIIDDVSKKVFEFLDSNIEQQALLFTKQRYQNKIIQKLNLSSSTIDDYKSNLNNLVDITQLQSVYSSEIEKLNDIVNNRDYIEALKVINNKGLLPYTQLANIFGWKKNYYIDYILSLMEKDDEVANELKQVFKQFISNL